MFQRTDKKSKSSTKKSLRDLIAIQTPDQLLSSVKRQELLAHIQKLSGMESARFNSLVLTLIHHFIHHAQQLPETSHSYYTQLGGLIDHALNRTEAALELFRQHVLSDSNTLSEAQLLWLYVLLSASILKGIGKLQIDYQVAIYDVNGQWVKQWNPLLESLVAQGSYYNYEFLSESDAALRRRINLLLAKFLLPAKGFEWIASHAEALAIWLALINEDWESAGTLGALLVRADAIAIQRDFNEFLLRQINHRGRLGRISTFIDSSLDALEDKDRLMGVSFLQWLMQALEKGKILLNKSPLFMVPGGMLISAEAFQWFVREHPEFKNWQAVERAFKTFNLHQQGQNNQAMSRFEQPRTQQVITGTVLADYAIVLPAQMKLHELNTGKVSQVSALNVIQSASVQNHFIQQHIAPNVTATSLQQLNSHGQWQTTEKTNASTQGFERNRG